MENIFSFATLGLVGYLLIIGFIVTTLYKSDASTKEKRRSIIGLSLGTRQFGMLAIASMLAVTMIGPADAIALSENGLKYGALWSLFPLGAALALFVSGKFIVGRVYETQIGNATIGDIFHNSCSRSSRFLVGLIVTIQTIAFSGVLIIAGGEVLETFLGIERILGMALTAIVVGLYTSFAGMDGVTKTDLAQRIIASLILVLIIIAIVFMFFTNDTSTIEVFTKADFSQDFPIKTMIAFFSAYFFGELMLPTYTQRVLISDSAKTARNGFMLGGAFLALWYILITLAGSMSEFINTGSNASSFVLLDITRVFLPQGSLIWGLTGAIVFAGILSLIHSTYDSFLQVGSTSFAKDVVGSFVTNNDKLLAQVAKYSVIVISVLGLVIGLWFDNIIDALIFGYTIWVPSLLAPFLFIVFKKQSHKLSELVFWLAFFSGTLTWLIIEYIKTPIGVWSYCPSIVYGLIVNFAVLFIGSYLKKG